MPKKQRIYDYFSEFVSEALLIVIFKNLVKSMMKLKVTPSFCFAFKIPDNVTASKIYIFFLLQFLVAEAFLFDNMIYVLILSYVHLATSKDTKHLQWFEGYQKYKNN